MATIMPIRAAGGAIADVSSVVFTKGGSRYPLDYNVDFNYKLDPSVAVVDPQNIRNFMNAIQPFSQMSRTQISPVNTNRNWATNDNGVLQGGLCWGVGVSYDVIGSDGADFSREAFGLQMDLALTDDNPISVFVFVHSKNTLLFNGQGVQVVS
tara:strand:- start:856 stop:1314 length:459 start_codon:yes stop_codon:yes gene_type:complete